LSKYILKRNISLNTHVYLTAADAQAVSFTDDNQNMALFTSAGER